MEIQVEIQVEKQELYSEPARPFGRDGAQPVSNFHDCGIARVSNKAETVVFSKHAVLIHSNMVLGLFFKKKIKKSLARKDNFKTTVAPIMKHEHTVQMVQL